MMLVGIDPGTNTGLAVWDSGCQKFGQVKSVPIHRALEEVGMLSIAMPPLFVIFEDARQRQWFGRMDAEQRKYGAAVREGAGAAKRDAAIWEDFLEDSGIPYLARKPHAGGSKWSAEYFRATTKWAERTNEHARDAGVLVFGYSLQDVQRLHASWEQRRANQAASTSARR